MKWDFSMLEKWPIFGVKNIKFYGAEVILNRNKEDLFTFLRIFEKNLFWILVTISKQIGNQAYKEPS